MAPLFITVVLVRVRGSYTHSANTPVRVAPVQVPCGPTLCSSISTYDECVFSLVVWTLALNGYASWPLAGWSLRLRLRLL